MSGQLTWATILIAAALAACAKAGEGLPVYAADQCRRVALTDAATGALVTGAEDLDFDPRQQEIYISAHDRRAVERAANRKGDAPPQGGLYRAPIAMLGSAATLRPLVDAASIPGGLRPHGVSFDPSTNDIYFINRAYAEVGGKWLMTPQILRADADGAVRSGSDASPRCSANDLATLAGEVVVSFDHVACGWRAGLENFRGSRATGIETAMGAVAFTGARHANGLVALQDGRLALASTRDKAILILRRHGERFTLDQALPTPGGPDNLTLSGDGAIVAALHPSLFSIGLSRGLGLGRSGSRIVRVDPEGGAVTLLFDDPKAALFSAASVAIEESGTLIVGSALDEGLLVCAKRAP